jgi:prophage antirepressor-like protein
MDSFPEAAIHRVSWPDGGREIRIVRHSGEPWFVAADICRALNLFVNRRGELNVTLALAPVKADDKLLARLETSPNTFRPYTRYMLISPRGLVQLLTASGKAPAENVPAAFQAMIEAAFTVMREVIGGKPARDQDEADAQQRKA